jgi:hypothetical protein
VTTSGKNTHHLIEHVETKQDAALLNKREGKQEEAAFILLRRRGNFSISFVKK